MEWISVKDRKPPCNGNRAPFVMAYHSVHGNGVAWFYVAEDYEIEELEEDYKSKYICSCHFIKSWLDENYNVDEEEYINIMENSPDFVNLGTVTHWFPYPENPYPVFSYGGR